MVKNIGRILYLIGFIGELVFLSILNLRYGIEAGMYGSILYICGAVLTIGSFARLLIQEK